MFDTVAIPVWAIVLFGLFAALSILERVIGPGVRWFFRRRAERVVAQLNTRLQRPIEPFKLARRHDMIQRLKYDPEVALAIVEHAREKGVREDVAFEMVERYAREIVPSFSASAYFGFGTRASRWISKLLYDVRVGAVDETALNEIDPDAAVVFVMNHRSNMDYVLVTWLVSQRSALSYAVGEWARIWPLSALIRTMGAFFIRRKSRNALYRKVLSRYVQMAAQGGVAQAVFPEGGLSLTGQMAPPKLGFLNYIVSGYQPEGRNVIFVPVALNYDRVLEDRILMAADKAGERRFRGSIPTVLRFTIRQVWRMLCGRFKKFGSAAVTFGAPMSLSDVAEGDAERVTMQIGTDLRQRINDVMPVLPVPLVASIIQDKGTLDTAALIAETNERLGILRAKSARLHVPETAEATVEAGLYILLWRKLVTQEDDRISPVEAEAETLGFYANSIRHLL